MICNKFIKKIFSLLLLFSFILAILTIASCSSPKKEDSEAWYSFTDYNGKVIKLNEKPKKVAVLFSSLADIWTLSGGDIAITVGESIERGFADENTLLVDNSSGHLNINTELLLSENPDLVIATADYPIQRECVEFLTSAGINAASFKIESFADYLSILKIFTDINERSDIYEKHGKEQEEKINSLLSAIPDYEGNSKRNDILFIRAGSSSRSTKVKDSNDNFACRMLKDIGCFNIADSSPFLLDTLSLEAIMVTDPDFIFISPMGNEEAAKLYISDLFKEDGWSSLKAVKENKIIFLEKDLFHYKPNSRWYEAYSFLFQTIFSEIDETN